MWKLRKQIAWSLVTIQLYLLWFGYYLSNKIAWVAVLILIPFIIWLAYTIYKDVYEKK
jgi:hypothetical protein